MSIIPVQFHGLIGSDAFLRPLSVADVKQCVAVESSFPEHERCSEPKFKYRLSQAPHLSLGLFINTEKGEKLIAQVIGLRWSSTVITEGSMSMPKNWESLPSQAIFQDGQLIGNDPNGPVIAIHSVVVQKEYQARGLGRDLVKAYILYLNSIRVSAEHVILIAHDHLIPFYESCGFENRGLGECQFAGGVWYDMVLTL